MKAAVMAPPSTKDELTKQLEDFKKEEQFLLKMKSHLEQRIARLQAEEMYLVLKSTGK